MGKRVLYLGFIAAITLGAVAPTFADDCSNATAQTDMDICAGQQFAQADKALNTAYAKLIAKVSPQGRSSLQAAERSWLAYRDKQCAFETLGQIDGSIYPMVLANCKTDLTLVQTKRLDDQVNCQEGDLSCGDQ